MMRLSDIRQHNIVRFRVGRNEPVEGTYIVVGSEAEWIGWPRACNVSNESNTGVKVTEEQGRQGSVASDFSYFVHPLKHLTAHHIDFPRTVEYALGHHT